MLHCPSAVPTALPFTQALPCLTALDVDQLGVDQNHGLARSTSRCRHLCDAAGMNRRAWLGAPGEGRERHAATDGASVGCSIPRPQRPRPCWPFQPTKCKHSHCPTKPCRKGRMLYPTMFCGAMSTNTSASSFTSSAVTEPNVIWSAMGGAAAGRRGLKSCTWQCYKG